MITRKNRTREIGNARRRKRGRGKDFRFSTNRWREIAWVEEREKNHVRYSVRMLEEMSDRSWLQKATARILSGRWFWVDITCPTGANETPGRQKSRRQAVRKSSWRCTDSPFLKWEERRGAAPYLSIQNGALLIYLSRWKTRSQRVTMTRMISRLYKGKGSRGKSRPL